MSRTRVNNHKGTARRLYFNRLRRHDSHEDIVDRSLKRPPIENKLHVIVKHVRRSLDQMLAKLISALAHHVQEQDAPLRCIDKIFERRRKDTEGLRKLLILTRACWH
jgi:hypothetical protein